MNKYGIYPPLFTDPEGDSCFSVYQIRWIKKCCFINGHNFFFWNFRKTRKTVKLYPRIFQVMGANQNGQKLLSTDLVNTTNNNYCYSFFFILFIIMSIIFFILIILFINDFKMRSQFKSPYLVNGQTNKQILNFS